MEVGDIEDVALRDRRMLSADGIFIVVATVSSRTAARSSRPEIIFRGVPFVDEADGFVDDLRGAVDDSLAHSAKERDHARSTCSRTTCTTTWPTSSTTASSGAR